LQTAELLGEKTTPSLVAEKDSSAYAPHRLILTYDLHFSILCSGPNRAANGGLKNQIIKNFNIKRLKQFMCESFA
jgi:hypothetical protein